MHKLQTSSHRNYSMSSSNASFEKTELSRLSCHSRCRLERQSYLKRDRKSRKAAIFGSLDDVLSGKGIARTAEDLRSCDATFSCDSMDLKVEEEESGEMTLKKDHYQKIIKSSSSSSLGALTAGARSLSRGAKSLLSASNHNRRGSASRRSDSEEESSLARKKSLRSVGNTTSKKNNSSSKRTTSLRKSKSSGKSKKDKIFEASQAEALVMLVAQELDDMDC
jgi:hypothetical protein